MTCPDIALLAEEGSDKALDLATRAHLAECEECRATHRMLVLAREAYASEATVGDIELAAVTQMVMSQLVPDHRGTVARAWDTVSLGLLGATTIGAVLVLTGAAGGLETRELWLALIVAGLIPMAREMRAPWPSRLPALDISALGDRG